MRRLVILSVHYRHPELLRDALARIRRCAGPVREELGAELRFWVIVHRWAFPEALEAVTTEPELCSDFAGWIDLRDLPPEEIPRDGRCHGNSLYKAYWKLRAEGRLADDDLIAVLDHDAHPLHVRTFALLGAPLLAAGAPAGIGIPQWHRGHCFLHPSMLITRVEMVEAVGPRRAFRMRLPTPTSLWWCDTCEGLTLWCEASGRPILPLRVESTAFPWSKWDSDMVPNWGTRLAGWHGEPVEVGNLMRYGIEPGVPLVSHLWAGPLGPYRWMNFAAWTWDEVLAAYLAEPLAED